MYNNRQLNHLQPHDFFGYFFIPKDGLPTAAVFVRERHKPGFARLFLCNPTKTSANEEQAIAQAQADVLALQTSTQPVCHLMTDIAPLISALYHHGYDWPVADKVEMRITSIDETNLQTANV